MARCLRWVTSITLGNRPLSIISDAWHSRAGVDAARWAAWLVPKRQSRSCRNISRDRFRPWHKLSWLAGGSESLELKPDQKNIRSGSFATYAAKDRGPVIMLPWQASPLSSLAQANVGARPPVSEIAPALCVSLHRCLRVSRRALSSTISESAPARDVTRTTTSARGLSGTSPRTSTSAST
jgi:hypothetical protein